MAMLLPHTHLFPVAAIDSLYFSFAAKGHEICRLAQHAVLRNAQSRFRGSLAVGCHLQRRPQCTPEAAHLGYVRPLLRQCQRTPSFREEVRPFSPSYRSATSRLEYRAVLAARTPSGLLRSAYSSRGTVAQYRGSVSFD